MREIWHTVQRFSHSIQMPENEDLCFKVMVSFQFVQNHPHTSKNNQNFSQFCWYWGEPFKRVPQQRERAINLKSIPVSPPYHNGWFEVPPIKICEGPDLPTQINQTVSNWVFSVSSYILVFRLDGTFVIIHFEVAW